MTVSQLANIQHRIATDLADVVDWTKHVRPDPDAGRKTTGDAAYVVIATEFNRYRISCHSNYVEPPAGATYECRALGTLTFDDFAGDKHIVAPKNDLTWIEISKHIHVRELTDAIAAERRMLAEASADKHAEIHARLVVLAERGKKWGVEAKRAIVPMAAQIAAQAQTAMAAIENEHQRVQHEAINNQVPAGTVPSAPSVFVPPVDGAIYPGARIYFITNPGEQISGMQELPGLCVKVHDGEFISAFITPDHSEPFYRDKLPKRSETHPFNCWDFNPADQRQARRIRHLEEAIEKMADEGNAMLERIVALEARAPDNAKLAKAQAEITEAKAKAKRSRAA